MTEDSQVGFFEQIQTRFNSKPEMVKAIMELLSITSDSAYRRINGETDLRWKEILILCKTFNISLDSLIEYQRPLTTFNLHHDIGDGDTSEVMGGFSHLVDLFVRLRRAEESEIVYFTMELPLFHIIEIPELLAFKMYYWESIRSMSDDSLFSLEGDKGYKESDLQLVRKVTDGYNSIESTEIIYKDSFSSTLTQITSFLEQGRFKNPTEALVLFDRLLDLLEHLKYQARIGQKFAFGEEPPSQGSTGNYELFYNDSIFSQNTALVRSRDEKMVYLEHNVINFLYTSDSKFFKYTEERLHAIMAKSSLISKVSERARNTYFNKLKASISKAKDDAGRNF